MRFIVFVFFIWIILSIVSRKLTWVSSSMLMTEQWRKALLSTWTLSKESFISYRKSRKIRSKGINLGSLESKETLWHVSGLQSTETHYCLHEFYIDLEKRVHTIFFNLTTNVEFFFFKLDLSFFRPTVLTVRTNWFANWFGTVWYGICDALFKPKVTFEVSPDISLQKIIQFPNTILKITPHSNF